jgi:carboxypeptidase family protein
MRRLALGICCLALGEIAFGQAVFASLSGVVTTPGGQVVPNAPAQLIDERGNSVARTQTTSDGRYTFASLPPGVYTLSIQMPCCAISSFRQSDVRLNAGQKLEMDVHLKTGGSQSTLGDDPGTVANAIRNRSRAVAKRTPRLANGKPDLSGIWLVNVDRYPEQASPLPWAAAVQKQRGDGNRLLSLNTRCLPDGIPTPAGGATPFFVKFAQHPTLMLVLFEGPPGFRQIFLDGRNHPADPNPAWLGHSIGKWDGDTLVVDTVGYNEDSQVLEAYPHTDRLHVVERYRRADFSHLQVQVTYDDPGTFTKAVTRNMEWDLAADEELIEFVCENNKEGR